TTALSYGSAVFVFSAPAPRVVCCPADTGLKMDTFSLKTCKIGPKQAWHRRCFIALHDNGFDNHCGVVRGRLLRRSGLRSDCPDGISGRRGLSFWPGDFSSV